MSGTPGQTRQDGPTRQPQVCKAARLPPKLDLAVRPAHGEASVYSCGRTYASVRGATQFRGAKVSSEDIGIGASAVEVPRAVGERYAQWSSRAEIDIMMRNGTPRAHVHTLSGRGRFPIIKRTRMSSASSPYRQAQVPALRSAYDVVENCGSRLRNIHRQCPRSFDKAQLRAEVTHQPLKLGLREHPHRGRRVSEFGFEPAGDTYAE